MSFLRFLSISMFIVFIVFCASIGSVFSEMDHGTSKGSYQMGRHMFYHCYAFAWNDDPGIEGWYSAWAEAGNGGRDLKGGNYEGLLDECALSIHRTPVANIIPPKPYFVASFINGGPIEPPPPFVPRPIVPFPRPTSS